MRAGSIAGEEIVRRPGRVGGRRCVVVGGAVPHPRAPSPLAITRQVQVNHERAAVQSTESQRAQGVACAG